MSLLIEDSDFVAKESGSDDALEFDSDAKVSDQDSNEEGEEKEDEERGRKRTKEQPKTKPAKKRKEVTLVYLTPLILILITRSLPHLVRKNKEPRKILVLLRNLSRLTFCGYKKCDQQLKRITLVFL